MADQDTPREDRRIPASARKLQKARDEGQVARSRDLGHALLLGLTGTVLFSAAGAFGRSTQAMLAGALGFDRRAALDTAGLNLWFGALASKALLIAVPVALAGVAAGVLASVAMGGVGFGFGPLKVKFSRLSPAAGFARLLNRDHFLDSGRLALVVAVMAVLASAFVWLRAGQFATMASMPLGSAMPFAFGLLVEGAGWLMGLLLLLAGVDAPLQWFRHRANLRMTEHEAKQEHREAEGDPMLKGRIRARQREMSMARMMARVPEADVVVTNPSHFAVALKYDDARMGAPRVIAKGVELVALRIREVATEAGVPILESPALARALYAHVELDAEIPRELYNAVAQVLAYVFQLDQWRTGRAEEPRPLDVVDVPAELDPGVRDAGGGQ